MNNIYYIAHGGPGSGRYPLGSGERPYQKYEGSRRKSGGISGYIRSRKTKKAEEKAHKQRNEELRKRLEAEQRKRQHEADKERVLRKGSATEVMKYQGELTNQELSDVSERLRLEKQISGYKADETKKALDKLKTIQSYTNVGSALAKDGIEIWNSFASIYNATSEGKKNPLSLVKKEDKKK